MGISICGWNMSFLRSVVYIRYNSDWLAYIFFLYLDFNLKLIFGASIGLKINLKSYSLWKDLRTCRPTLSLLSNWMKWISSKKLNNMLTHFFKTEKWYGQLSNLDPAHSASKLWRRKIGKLLLKFECKKKVFFLTHMRFRATFLLFAFEKKQKDVK